jgi:photosystem II stability/assembly factor-like uncharacterized protein
MKKLLLFLSAFFWALSLCTTGLLAQQGWYAQSSGTTERLWGVSFTDANTGTVVGWNGTILHTTDGGTTWTPQSSGTTNRLYGVYFTDANTGTVVGSFGEILRTTNGGTTWTPQVSGKTAILYGVFFTDATRELP